MGRGELGLSDIGGVLNAHVSTCLGKCCGSATNVEWGIWLPCKPHELQWQLPFAYRQRQTRQDSDGNRLSCIILRKKKLASRQGIKEGNL